MSDTSVKLGLLLPTQVDPFLTSDVRANFEKIDASPGTFICTSSTRPTWTSAQAGRRIYETNTGLEWIWDGAAFKRVGGFGLLKRSDGSWAIGERTSNGSTGFNTYAVITSVTNVVVPAGNRPLRIDCSWASASNPVGSTALAIFRSNVANTGPSLGYMFVATPSASGGGGSFYALERDGLAAGVYNFSLQFRVAGSTGGGNVTTMIADSIQPISIAVSEM